MLGLGRLDDPSRARELALLFCSRDTTLTANLVQAFYIGEYVVIILLADVEFRPLDIPALDEFAAVSALLQTVHVTDRDTDSMI